MSDWFLCTKVIILLLLAVAPAITACWCHQSITVVYGLAGMGLMLLALFFWSPK